MLRLRLRLRWCRNWMKFVLYSVRSSFWALVVSRLKESSEEMLQCRFCYALHLPLEDSEPWSSQKCLQFYMLKRSVLWTSRRLAARPLLCWLKRPLRRKGFLPLVVRESRSTSGLSGTVEPILGGILFMAVLISDEHLEHSCFGASFGMV